MAAPAGGTAAGGPRTTNWFQEWAGRTPVVSRWAIFVTLGGTLIAWLTGLSYWLAVVPYAVLRGQVWRVLTSLIDQGSLLTTMFVLLMLSGASPPAELRKGSAAYLVHLVGTGVLINVLYCALAALLWLVPWDFARMYMVVPSMGLWPMLLSELTINALADPSGSSTFCCVRLNNRVFPWFLWGIFSLLSFFPLLDMLLGVLVGHAFSYRLLRWMEPSAARIQAWETTGWAALIRLTLASGFVRAPTSTLPAGTRDVERERIEAAWAGFGATGMFGGPGRGAAARAQQGGDASGSGGAGGSAGAATPAYLFRPGTRPAAGAGGAAPAGGAPPASFAGAGRTLGGPPPAAEADPEAGQAGGRFSLLSSLWGGGAAASSGSPGGGYAAVPSPSGAPGGSHAPGGHGASSVAAEERRRAMAAAAEQRMRASAARGIPTPPADAPADSGFAARATPAPSAPTGGGGSAGSVDLLGIAAPGATTAEASTPSRSGYGRAVAAAFAGADPAPPDSAPLLPLRQQGGATDAVRAAAAGGDDDEFGFDAAAGPSGRGAPRPQAAGVSAAAAKAPSAGTAYPEQLALLEEMGFGRDAAAAALQRAGGDVDAALGFLA